MADTNYEGNGAAERLEQQPLHIVGIGASAGGLEALEALFAAMPERTDMAFVVLQHLSPDFESKMDELLARRTRIPIQQVTDGVLVEADRIYLIPPRKDMILSGGHLLLTDKEPSRGFTLPIDHFLRSLAQDAGHNSIAVILSGTGSDGSRGLKEIHAATRHVPPAFLVDQHHELLHSFGGAEKLLSLRGGRVTTNLLELVPDGLRAPLAGGLQQAAKQERAVRYTRLDIPVDGEQARYQVTIQPLPDAKLGTVNFVVELEPLAEEVRPQPVAEVDLDQTSRDYIGSLEGELRFTRENLQGARGG